MVDLPVIEDKTDPTSIPIIVSVSVEDFGKITKTGRAWNITSILDVIKAYAADTYEKIKDMVKGQVVLPDSDSSYEKLITAFVKAADASERCTWAMGKNKTVDTYQIYLDDRDHRIIVSIYYGSKTIVV
jgi:hypothetical protein